MPFWVKNSLGQEVHYYMVYIAYFTELILQICDYSQKWRIWRENCKYALDENLYCHFCSRREAAKFCHPDKEWNPNFITIWGLSLFIFVLPLTSSTMSTTNLLPVVTHLMSFVRSLRLLIVNFCFAFYQDCCHFTGLKILLFIWSEIHLNSH